MTLSIALVYAGLGTKMGYDFIVYAFGRNIKSNSWLMTPLQWPELVMPIGFALLTLVLLIEVIKAVINMRSGIITEKTYAEKATETTI